LIADLVGHVKTSTTRTAYRHQLLPVITKEADLLDEVFCETLKEPNLEGDWLLRESPGSSGRGFLLVDLTGCYYNSPPKVRASLTRLRGLIGAISADERPEPAPQLSQCWRRATARREQFATASTSTH
jgi:hypothetical protein